MSKTFGTPMFAVMCAVFAGTAATANANFLTPGFSGNTEYEGWLGLSRTNNQQVIDANAGPNPFPDFFGSTSLWPEAIVPDAPGSAGNASFDKISGGGYPAGESIYNSFNPGTYTIVNNNALAGVENVLFQLELGAGFTEFGPNGIPGFFDVAPGSMPVLNYNGGTQALAATVELSFPGGRSFPNPGPGPATINSEIFAFQWDLSGLGPITSYDIVWTGIAFGTNYQMQLDSSDVFTAVPTPGSAALLGLAGFAAMRRRFS